MISTTDFRGGVRLMVDGEPFYIVEFQHVKPGKGGAFVRTKLKSYLSGNVLDRTFRSGERFEEPDLEERDNAIPLCDRTTTTPSWTRTPTSN